MSNPQYVISGQMRRDLKKRLNRLKASIIYIPKHNEMVYVYGGFSIEDETADKIKSEIAYIEKQLSVKWIDITEPKK